MPTPVPAPSIPSLFDFSKFLSSGAEFSFSGYLTRFLPLWIVNFDFAGFIASVKLVSFILCIILSFILTVLLMRTRRLIAEVPTIGQELNPPAAASGGAMGARWTEITKHMDSAKEAEWKFGVIEADKLVELVLKRAGFSGDTMGERLMGIREGQLASLEYLWAAHKVRNRLAHDVDYFLRYSEAKQAIECYEAVLKELGAI